MCDNCFKNPGTTRRGDLLVCSECAKLWPANVGRVEGEVRCYCGYFKPVGTPCGEPCL